MNLKIEKTKKWLSIALVAVMVLSSAPLAGFVGIELPVPAARAATVADNGTCGDNATWTLDSDGVLTVSGTGAIADNAFVQNDEVKRVVIEDGITSIGVVAFGECTSLTSVQIADSVTRIDASAFASCTSLTEIDLPDTMTAIEEGAFYNCTALAQIDLPAGLTAIPRMLFNGCSALQSVIIPNGVTSIGETAFAFCTSLASVLVPDSVTSIALGAFMGCTALKGIDLPASVADIGLSAFYGCENLQMIYIRNSACEIADEEGENAGCTIPAQAVIYGCIDSTAHVFAETYGRDFEAILGSDECGKNATWTLVDGVLTVSGTGAMYDYADNEISALASAPWYSAAASIHTVIVEDGITHIGAWAFDQCGLQNGVSIPDSVTNIGTFAFRATQLRSVTIPDSVKSIGDGVFGFNDQISEITLSENNEYFVFENGTLYDINKTNLICCTDRSNASVFVIPSTVRQIGTLAFYNCTGLTGITIPEGVQTIGNGAFWNCRSVTSIHIPSTVTYIDDLAFGFMAGLETITVSASNPYYTVVDNVLYSKDKTRLLHYAAQKDDTSFEVPQSVTGIDGGAFSDCENLVSVSIPESVISIGWDAFENCTALTDVNIPSRITELNSTFNNCSSLQSITLPANLVCINNDAFLNCASLESIVIPDSVVRIDTNAFKNCASLTSVNIPAGVTFIGNEAFTGCCGLESFDVDAENEYYLSDEGVLYTKDHTQLIGYPACKNATEYRVLDGTLNIANGAFAEAELLTRVELPVGVMHIGDEAFAECRALSEINLPDGISYIGDSAFAVCQALTAVELPDGLTTISEGVFVGCSSLADVQIPDSVTSIGYGAFFECAALGEITLPDSVQSVGSSAFMYCASLASVTLSERLKAIPEMAFVYCVSLEDITLPASVESVSKDAFLYCYALENVHVNANNETYSSVDGVLYNKEQTDLLLYPAGKTATSFGIPESVQTLGFASFAFNNYLTEMDVPETVSRIDYGAFIMCENLQTLTVRNAGCEIVDDDGSTVPEQTVMYGYADSTAQTYAETYDREFVALEEDEEEKILYSGECEEGLSWTLSSLGIFRISGEGRLTKIIFNSILTPTLPTLVSALTVIVEGGVESISEDALEKLAGCPDVYILDPYCEIADSAATVPESAVIHGLANSTAKEYADKYGREFEVIEVDCEHVWNSGEVITAPTCSVEGSKLYLCTVCRASKTESIAVDANAHGDNTELRDAQAATQTQPGYTGDLYCLDCGQMLTEGEAIPADVISSFRVESDGVIDEDGIVRLNVYLDDFAGLTSFNLYVDIDETQFTYEGIEFGADSLALNTLMSEEIEVYCNFWQGQVEIAGMFRHCLYSAEHYNNDSINADNFHVITVLLSVNDESVDTLDLTATSIFEFWGLTQDGYIYPAIGFVEDLTATLNTSVHSHDWVLTETVQGTCTQAGSLLYTCSVCNETKTETGTTHPSNHAGGTEVRGAFAETCGKDGYTGDTYCLGCGVKIASGSAIPATGNHTWDNGVVTLEPTYTAPGVRTYTCTVCDATRTEEVEQLVAEYVGDDKSTIMEDVGLVAVAGNKVSDFLANASDGAVILDKNGKEMKADAIPGTGATLVLPDGTEHTIVVLGDVNGDGRVLAGDARLALRSAVGLESLEDSYYKAANVNSVSEVEVADARMILRASVHLEDPADWFESTVQ